MPGSDLTDAQLIAFANEYLRTFADQIVRIDQNLPVIVATYNSRNLGSIINAGGASNTLADGSAQNGRTTRTGGDVYNIITLIQDLKTFLDVTGRRDVILGWQVNGLR
jgi:hypothetical protein